MRNETRIADLKGDGYSSSITVTEQGVRLPNQPARYVILSNWNTANEPELSLLENPDGLAPTELENEIYWGFRGVFAHQLFPGGTTELIPVNDLSQITIRTRIGKSKTIWYSWIL